MNNKLSAKPHYFERGLLKSNAKLVLSADYAPVLFGVLLSTLIPLAIITPFFLTAAVIASSPPHMSTAPGNEIAVEDIVFRVATVAMDIIVLFIVPVFQVGRSSFLLKARTQSAKIKHIFDGFRKGSFFKVIRKMLAVNLVVYAPPMLVLLGILLITVYFGIGNTEHFNSIMAAFSVAFLADTAFLMFLRYKYMPASYILAENPNISVRKLFSDCRKMTDGYKRDLFVLDLSFILWRLPRIILGGIVDILVMPYVQTTVTEAYCLIKSNYLHITDSDPDAGATAYILDRSAALSPSTVEPPPNVAPIAVTYAPAAAAAPSAAYTPPLATLHVARRPAAVTAPPVYKKPITPTEEYVNEHAEADPLPILMVDDEDSAVDAAPSSDTADNDE